jgi:hypothetical protein
MKKIYYEAGPDEINVGPTNNQTQMKRGVAVDFDDKIAASLLKKPMFKEGKGNPAVQVPKSENTEKEG